MAQSDPSNSQRPPAPASGSGERDAASAPRKRPTYDPNSFEYALLSGFAGGVAGCVAKTSVAPLDRVKILFQTRSPDYQRYAGTWLGVFRASKDIYAETGIRGLLQGHSATLLRIFPYAAIKFLMYERFHHVSLLAPAHGESVSSVIVTYPLELIRVRLAFESHHSQTERSSLLRTIRLIYSSPTLPSPSPTSSLANSASSHPPTPAAPKPSLTHFYRGIFPTLGGIVPYAGVSFLVWGFLKHDLFPSHLSPTFRASHRTSMDLVAGGLAGAIGQTAAYPFDIIRRRMQVSAVLPGGTNSHGMWKTAQSVWKMAGWRGFYVGLSIGYLKVVPMNAVSFATWVGLKDQLGLDVRSTYSTLGESR
ncbi:hypothetical protein RQP46_004460 [Phenoliferia psychrophenolica]